MSLTYSELLERLKKIDEISLLEVLEISSEELVDKFGDKIEEKLESLMEDLQDEEDDSAA